jgi:hypothetical protein
MELMFFIVLLLQYTVWEMTKSSVHCYLLLASCDVMGVAAQFLLATVHADLGWDGQTQPLGGRAAWGPVRAAACVQQLAPGGGGGGGVLAAGGEGGGAPQRAGGQGQGRPGGRSLAGLLL